MFASAEAVVPMRGGADHAQLGAARASAPVECPRVARVAVERVLEEMPSLDDELPYLRGQLVAREVEREEPGARIVHRARVTKNRDDRG